MLDLQTDITFAYNNENMKIKFTDNDESIVIRCNIGSNALHVCIYQLNRHRFVCIHCQTNFDRFSLIRAQQYHHFWYALRCQCISAYATYNCTVLREIMSLRCAPTNNRTLSKTKLKRDCIVGNRTHKQEE